LWHLEGVKQGGLKNSAIMEGFVHWHQKNLLKNTKKNKHLYGNDEIRNLCDDSTDEQLDQLIIKKIENLQNIEVYITQISTKDHNHYY
jgi:hypothetical protein